VYKHQEWLIETINEHRCQKVVEIGVDGAQTSVLVLENCPSLAGYYMVDPWRPYTKGTDRCFLQRTPERWEELYQLVLERVAPFPAAQIVRLSSLKAARHFKPATFDLVFIDGDHSYEAVMADIAAWEPLVRPGGILSGHDYGVGSWGVTKAVQECFPDNGFHTLYPKSSTWWVQK